MGLMAGSIAKSIKKYNLADRIIAYNRSDRNIVPALKEGVVDMRASAVGEEFADCDIIFLCCPVQINIRLAQQVAPFLKKSCILTDVGSTKGDIHEAMRQGSPDICFVGGHPMTGSEKSGYDATSAQLFENICYVLSPGPSASDDAVQTMVNLVKDIKSLPIVIDPYKHDEATAAISHMPHLLAVALVNAVGEMDLSNGYMKELAAGGFRDMSRIAVASPDMWAPIYQANKKPIIKALDTLTNEIAYMRTVVERGDTTTVYDTYKTARDYRESMHFSSRGPLLEEYSFTIDVDDTPGIIAKIATILSEHDVNIKNIGILNKRESEEGVLKIVFEDEAHLNDSAKLLTELGHTVHLKA